MNKKSVQYQFDIYRHRQELWFDSLLEACEKAIEDHESGEAAFVQVVGKGRTLVEIEQLRQYIEDYGTETLLREAYHTDDRGHIRACLRLIAENLHLDILGEKE